MKSILTFIGILLLAATAFPQEVKPGTLIVRQDPLLDSLLVKYEIIRQQILNYTDNKGIPGYRIQVFFDSGINSGDRARKVKEEFEMMYPHIPGYISWKAPNFRVRVGDFRSRLEAEKALQEIMATYPNAWVIKDEINYPQIF